MSHSHLAIRHLVKKLEMSGPRKTQRATLPAWLTRFVEDFSERFEPFSGVARVGYECLQAEEGWELSLFLGEHETVGGPEDGDVRPINFRFNLLNVQQHFEEIHTLCWNAFPDNAGCLDVSSDLCLLIVEGVVRGTRLRVQIHAGPSQLTGPAIREYTDGRLEII